MIKISRNGFGIKKLCVVVNTKEILALNILGMSILVIKK